MAIEVVEAAPGSGMSYPDVKRGGVRPGAGRKKSPDALVFKTVGLTQAQWDWLALWLPGGSITSQFRSLLDRAMKFWPSGPTRFR
jgi:hypothetical protein